MGLGVWTGLGWIWAMGCSLGVSVECGGVSGCRAGQVKAKQSKASNVKASHYMHNANNKLHTTQKCFTQFKNGFPINRQFVHKRPTQFACDFDKKKFFRKIILQS